jgi:hypothetical protein
LTLLDAGWGDTATILLLSEVLDIDTLLWVAPDQRIKLTKDMPTLKCLKFRRHKEKASAGSRKLYLRFKHSHFIVLKPRQLNSKINPGSAANEDHYLNGTHDVATGMCVSVAGMCISVVGDEHRR